MKKELRDEQLLTDEHFFPINEDLEKLRDKQEIMEILKLSNNQWISLRQRYLAVFGLMHEEVPKKFSLRQIGLPYLENLMIYHNPMKVLTHILTKSGSHIKDMRHFYEQGFFKGSKRIEDAIKYLEEFSNCTIDDLNPELRERWNKYKQLFNEFLQKEFERYPEIIEYNKK